jgi:1,4-alpha-glucan branching enzyme
MTAHGIPDGWRLLQTITADKNARQPWKINIAEDMQDVDTVTRPTFAGGAGFDSQWDAGFVHPVRAGSRRLWTAHEAWTPCKRR